MPNLPGILLHGRPWKRSAARIAHGLSIPYTDHYSAARRLPFLVRWGSVDSVLYTPDLVINKKIAITGSSDKYQANQLLADDDVPCPKVTSLVSTAITEFGYPILGRMRHHFGGQGVRLYLQRTDFQRYGESDYYMPYIPKVREFRVYVGQFIDYDDWTNYYHWMCDNGLTNHMVLARGFDDGMYASLKVSEKIQVRSPLSSEDERYNGMTNEAAQSIIWNWASGYSYRAPVDTEYTDVLEPAIRSVAALGLTFGAVDVMISDESYGHPSAPYVLEVNTAPAVESQHTKSVLVSYIQNAINSRLDEQIFSTYYLPQAGIPLDGGVYEELEE